MLKIKENDTNLVRVGKSILQGLLIGGLIGAPIGIAIAFFGLEDGLQLPLEKILAGLQWGIYGAIVLAFVLAVVYIFSIRQEKVIYETLEDDDESETLYQNLGRKLGYGMVFVGAGVVLAIVNIVLGYRISFGEDSAQMNFPILAFASLILGLLLQMYLISLNNSIRGIKTTLAPTMKELKNNVLQLDEAELEANYKMCFDIVMTLSGAILPLIYALLMLMSIIFQRVELTGIFIAAGIHLYIIAMNFKMTRDYFK